MTTSITVTVNGVRHQVTVPPMKRLLDVLREDLGLTGTKEGCGEGECGACSVLVNDELVNSCLVPALQVDGAQVCTVEELAKHGDLHPLQKAFADAGGAQCGICTPGMLTAATYLLSKNPHPTREQIRDALSGNLCRCTGYGKIVEAVYQASGSEA
jgi:aerobic carbon-monoxide dehydrogenase small subunit